MPTVKFLIQSQSESAPVYLRLSVSKNEVFKRTTGLFIDARFWDAKNGSPKETRDVEIKQKAADLKSLEGYVMSSYYTDHKKGILVDGAWLRKTIDTLYNRVEISELDYFTTYCDYFLQELPVRATDGKKDSVGKRTQEKYNNIVQKLKEFETSQKRRYKLIVINVKYRNDFMRFLQDVKGITPNTAGRYVTVVKTILLDARRNGYSISPNVGDIKGSSTEPPKVTLTFEELNNIRESTFEDNSLAAARDWLIISCFVGQRVGDLMTMNATMINTQKGINMISLTQEKTGKLVSIPIHKEVRKILESREGNFPPRFFSDPAANNAKYNLLLKTVCKQAGIDSDTKGNIKDPETGKYGTGTYPKWMLVSSHVGRRSFATNFYAAEDYPTPWLMAITGHATEQMFLSYIDISRDDRSASLGEKWKQLGLI
ncbi:MAG: hypothetical protein EOO01_03480 [Chitinophagaceae bacterium]|nr:MAG: hypothetical protein EOO01_03480 [Chitinophagaceae bacterium]